MLWYFIPSITIYSYGQWGEGVLSIDAHNFTQVKMQWIGLMRVFDFVVNALVDSCMSSSDDTAPPSWDFCI